METAFTTIVVTTTDFETDVIISTATTSVDETETVTTIPTVIESITVTTTIGLPYTVALPAKREALTRPPYASVCNANEYTSACACLGVRPSTVTEPAYTKTIRVDHTTIQTIESTITSIGATQTNTNVVTQTVITTVIENTVVTQIETLQETLTIPTTVIITEVATATSTLAPTPPTCTGTGFYFVPSAPPDQTAQGFLGFINSIGQGIYMRIFSGGGSPLTVNANGDIVSYYSPDDIKRVVLNYNGAAAYQLWFSSDAANVHYTNPTPVTCSLGGAPGFTPTCTVAGSTDVYQMTICLDPVYFEWDAWIYSDASQLAGKNCMMAPINGICR